MIKSTLCCNKQKILAFYKGNLTYTLLTNIFKTTRLCNIQSKACIHIYKKFSWEAQGQNPQRIKRALLKKAQEKQAVIVELTVFFKSIIWTHTHTHTHMVSRVDQLFMRCPIKGSQLLSHAFRDTWLAMHARLTHSVSPNYTENETSLKTHKPNFPAF